MILNQNQARILIEIIIELFQRDAVIVAGPNHMWDQGNGCIRVVQDILDESFVVCIGYTAMSFADNDMWADIDADNIAFQEALVHLACLSSHMECRVRHLYSIGPYRFDRFISDDFSGRNKPISPQIFCYRRFSHYIRFNGTAPQNGFNMIFLVCCVQIAINCCIPVAIIVSADRQCHTSAIVQFSNHRKIVPTIHICIVTSQL